MEFPTANKPAVHAVEYVPGNCTVYSPARQKQHDVPVLYIPCCGCGGFAAGRSVLGVLEGSVAEDWGV